MRDFTETDRVAFAAARAPSRARKSSTTKLLTVMMSKSTLGSVATHDRARWLSLLANRHATRGAPATFTDRETACFGRRNHRIAANYAATLRKLCAQPLT